MQKSLDLGHGPKKAFGAFLQSFQFCRQLDGRLLCKIGSTQRNVIGMSLVSLQGEKRILQFVEHLSGEERRVKDHSRNAVGAL